MGDRIISLSSRGPEYGVHVMCSAGGWIHGQRQSLLQNATARIQLRLADPSESQMGHSSLESRDAARRTLNRPGFGLTDSLHELRVGCPGAGRSRHRRAGEHHRRRRAHRRCRRRDQTRELQRLPQRVELRAILEYEAAHPSALQAQDLSIAFAIGERHELGPVPLKLRESPGLMILGRQGCGKTLSLVAIGEAIMNRFSSRGSAADADRPENGPARSAGPARAGLCARVCLRPGRDRRGDNRTRATDPAAPTASQGPEPGGAARAQAVGRAPGTSCSSMMSKTCAPIRVTHPNPLWGRRCGS